MTDKERQSGVRRREVLLSGMALGLLAILVYLPHVIRGGWYYDDWILVAQLRDAAEGGIGRIYDAAQAMSYRPGYAVALTLLYKIGGTGQSSYLAVGVVLTALQGWLFFLVLRSVSVGRYAASAAAGLLVVLPCTDAVRLWMAAFPAGIALTLWLAGLLTGLVGLQRTSRRGQVLWHGAAVGLYLCAILTYEGCAGLVLAAGLLYLVKAGLRSAVPRVAADWATFGIAMAIMIPRASDTRPTQTGLHYLLDRVGELWHPARDVFVGMLPWSSVVGGPVGLALLFGGAVGVGRALAGPGATRRAVAPWVAMALAGVLFAAAGLAVLLPAESYFVPRSTGIGDRTNLFAAPGAVVLLMALLVLVPVGLGALLGLRRAPYLVGAALVAGTLLHLGWREHRQQDAWATAWRQEQQVVAAIKDAVPQLPAGASIVTFRHTTQLLPADVPVFSATWDLRGALWQAYDRPWMYARPWLPGVMCGARGLAELGQPDEPGAYQYGKLIFVDVAGRTAETITSRRRCDAALARLQA